VQIGFDAADLRPIVEAVVAELADRLAADDGRIAHSTAEVAQMLGVTPATIRDARLRGELEAVRVGRKCRFTKHQIMDYLARRTWQPKDRQNQERKPSKENTRL
jgi:excisionase family DNA binding protein